MIELHSSLDAFKLIQPHFNPYAEELWVLALNTHLQLLGKEMLFRGTVDSCPLHPRDIFRYLVMKNATAFILIHNHPSNSTEPSNEDIQATMRVRKIGKLMEIHLMDHLVITQRHYFSMADFGILKKITAKNGPKTQTALAR